MKYTNNTNIPLPLAVWLASDSYDYVTQPNYISATSLLKPLRSIILSRRANTNNSSTSVDISTLIPSSYGTAIHDSIEKAWITNKDKSLASLGLPKAVIDKVKINPTTITNGDIAVYLEQRTQKAIAGYVVGGKFDMVADGKLYDFKTTSTYTYINNTHEEDYRLQGSIYRWLNPEIIIDDHIYINYVFTDWSSAASRRDSKYPGSRILEFPVTLLSLAETEKFIRDKLNLISKYANSPEPEIPACNDTELWRAPNKFKYFADATKTSGRASKVFDNQTEANRWRATKGKGIVLFSGGEVKACKYCPAFNNCTQKDEYIQNGSLKLD